MAFIEVTDISKKYGRKQVLTDINFTAEKGDCIGIVGANLGFVEATVALHYVFDAPEDKLVFDVSHQCSRHL